MIDFVQNLQARNKFSEHIRFLGAHQSYKNHILATNLLLSYSSVWIIYLRNTN
jgi:hypothetical protein